MAITDDANKSSASQSTTTEGDVSYSQRLTTILLNEFNYLPWSRAITIALGGRSRLEFISGKDVNPGVTFPEYEAWLSKDQMSVCATIQREEVRRKVMINDATAPEARVYSANASLEKKPYKCKHSDMKCGHCNVPGHLVDRCWILHPELKPKFTKDKKGFIDKRHVTNPKAHMASHTTESFSSSPVALLNEFSNYLQEKHGQGAVQDEANSQGINEPAALLSKFSSFLSNSNCESSQGILLAFMSALEFSNLHDFWIVDSGATDHISNKLANVSDFIPFPKLSFVSVANGKGARVLGKGKIKLVSKSVESDVLYVPEMYHKERFAKLKKGVHIVNNVQGDITDTEVQSTNKASIADISPKQERNVSQRKRKYVMDLLKDSNVLYSKPVATPLDSKLKLKISGKPLRSASYYQKLMGKLIYLTITRPDISFAHTDDTFCDNQAAMHIAANPVFHERTKHIEVDCHYVRQQVQSKLIRTCYVRTNNQLADVFTKVQSSSFFSRLLSKLGSVNLMDPA
nr:hypothetical protein [Tanacetum cinerariifolium]